MDHAHDSHLGSHHASAGMAASATLHCLTGCAVGEITGLLIGGSLGLTTGATVALSVMLAFAFGFALSSLPLVRAGLGVAAALSVVVVADTLSIATMEVVDNLVMVVVPGAMEAGLGEPLYWGSMALALTVAFLAAWPVNRWLLARGHGHALTHEYMGAEAAGGLRRFIPEVSSVALAAVIAAFLAGGALAAAAG